MKRPARDDLTAVPGISETMRIACGEGIPSPRVYAIVPVARRILAGFFTLTPSHSLVRTMYEYIA